MKIVLLQSCDDAYANCLYATMDTHQRYARRYGYGYQWIISNLSPNPETANFNRYYLLRQEIDRQAYDWALWIDADAIVLDPSISLESIIEPDADKLLIACRGGHGGQWDINNGIFFLNLRRPRAKELVERCIDYCENLNPRSRGFRCDQAGMQAWLRQQEDAEGRIYLLRRYADEQYNLFNYDGSFIRHVLRTFGSIDQRCDELNRLAENDRLAPIRQQKMNLTGPGSMSFQKQNKILVVAPAAYDPLPESASALIESCYHYGIELQLIGQGQPFPNLRHKIKLVSDYLMVHPEYEYVLQLDLRDIVVCATLQEMFSKYLAFGHEIVASAERSCWPIPAHAYQSPDVGTSCRYLNSGSIFATRSAWLNAWQRMEEKINVWQGLASEVSAEEHELLKRDDQGAWSDLYINKEADIVIDARSELFQVLLYTDYRIARENPDYQFEGRRILNRETGTRPCLYHANGNVPIRPWWNYVLHPKPTWIWPLIERIRTAPREQLRDVAAVHDLLLELGLHETGGDNPSSWLSDQYLPYSGKGLQIWQRPDEFAEYLVWLSKRNTIRSYLEIGVNLGGSFIATTEYLKRFHQLDLAIGVDPWLSAPVKNYVRYTNGVDFIRGTRDSDRLRRLAEQTMFDLCMIDGDHAASAVRADWEFAQQHGRYVAFHDIAAPFMPGVQNLWQEIRSSHQSTHQFITRHREAKPAMGIGIVDLS